MRYGRALRGAKRLVLIYSAGHCGSTAMMRTLETMDVGGPLFDIHSLRRAAPARHPVPEGRIFLERLLGKRLPDPALDLRLLLAIREPVAADLSAHFWAFQSGHADLKAGFARGTVTAEALQARFLASEKHHRWIDKWLHEEVDGIFGLNPLGVPFDRDRGFQVLRKDRVTAVLVRQEDLARSWAPAVKALLDVDPPPLVQANRAENKSYAALYTAVRALPLPEAYLDEAYAAPYAQHYYTGEERARFRERWAGSVRRIHPPGS
jgi:hypothetical protein